MVFLIVTDGILYFFLWMIRSGRADYVSITFKLACSDNKWGIFTGYLSFISQTLGKKLFIFGCNCLLIWDGSNRKSYHGIHVWNASKSTAQIIPLKLGICSMEYGRHFDRNVHLELSTSHSFCQHCQHLFFWMLGNFLKIDFKCCLLFETLKICLLLMATDSLSGKQVGSQASCRVTRQLAWIQPVCIHITFVSLHR